MPEYPEIAHLAKQLEEVLTKKKIHKIDNYQEKSLNMSIETMHKHLSGKIIQSVEVKGKWLNILLDHKDYLAINLGMGGEIYYNLDHAKANTVLYFQDQSKVTIAFWWFGHVDYVKEGMHHTIDEQGYDLLEEQLSFDDFSSFIQTQRGRIKNVLLDQRKIAGIGNYYIHDILFDAKVHPLTKGKDLTSKQIKELYVSICKTFQEAVSSKGSFYLNV